MTVGPFHTEHSKKNTGLKGQAIAEKLLLVLPLAAFYCFSYHHVSLKMNDIQVLAIRRRGEEMPSETGDRQEKLCDNLIT